MYNSDPYNVFLVIATNIPQRLKTGFVVQGHIYKERKKVRHVEAIGQPNITPCDSLQKHKNKQS